MFTFYDFRYDRDMHVLCRKRLVFFLYSLRAAIYLYVKFSTGICRDLFLYSPQM